MNPRHDSHTGKPPSPQQPTDPIEDEDVEEQDRLATTFSDEPSLEENGSNADEKSPLVGEAIHEDLQQHDHNLREIPVSDSTLRRTRLPLDTSSPGVPPQRPTTSAEPSGKSIVMNDDNTLFNVYTPIRLREQGDTIDPDPLVSIMPCMDCDEIESHAFDCHLKHIHVRELQELNVLQLKDIANAVEYFDPEQWRKHHNPPPSPPPEDPEVVWKGMADIVRNDDRFKDDIELSSLDLADEEVVLLFILRTSTNIQCEIIRHNQVDNDNGEVVRIDAGSDASIEEAARLFAEAKDRTQNTDASDWSYF